MRAFIYLWVLNEYMYVLPIIIYLDFIFFVIFNDATKSASGVWLIAR